MHACIPSNCFFFQQGCWTGINLSSLVPLPYELKMAASIGVLDALTVTLNLWMNREEEKDEACETTTVAWLAGAAALAERERRYQGCFLKLSALPRCGSRTFFFSPVLCGFCFAEERRTFTDMWTSLDTFSFRAACAQKCLRQQFWAFFYTSLWRGPQCRTGFSRGVVTRRFLGFSLNWSTGKLKKKRSSLLELRTLFRFRLYKRKIGRLIQNDPRRKSKKWLKDVVCVSSHF